MFLTHYQTVEGRMNLTPQRKPGESFDAYKLRRRNENEAVRRALRPMPCEHYNDRPKLGKAATKQMKRDRQSRRLVTN